MYLKYFELPTEHMVFWHSVSSKTGRTRSIRVGGNFCIFFLDRNSNSIPPVLRPEFKSHFKADGMMFLTSSLVRTLIPKYETIKNKTLLKNGSDTQAGVA